MNVLLYKSNNIFSKISKLAYNSIPTIIHLNELKLDYISSKNDETYKQQITPFKEIKRAMGTKMLERTPSQLHNYVINREANKILKKFKGIEAKTTEAKFAALELLDYFKRMIEENPVTLNSRNASNMLTKLGRLEAKAELREWWKEGQQARILGKIGELMSQKTYKCDTEELTNSIWGIGFLGHKVLMVPLTGPVRTEKTFEILVHDIINRIVAEIVTLRPIDLTSLTEGLARMQYKNIDYVMKAITLEVRHKISRFNEIDLSRLLWALAHLGYPNRNGEDPDGLLSTIAWESKKRIGVFCSADLSRMIWAFAVLNFNDIQHMLWVISENGIKYLPKIEPNHAVKFLWAFNTLQHIPTKAAISKLCRHLSKGIQYLYPSDIMNVSLALANLGMVDDRVPTVLKENILNSMVHDLTAREAANIGWVLAIVDYLDHDVFMILRRYLLNAEIDGLPSKHKADIYRFFLHLNIYRPTLARLVPESLAQKCHESWIELQKQEKYSDIMTEVVNILKDEGYEIKINDPVHDGILLICSAVHNSNLLNNENQKYAIEIIAPPKCFKNDYNTTSGYQIWRENLLITWNYKIIRVEEKRWHRIKDDREKNEYLKYLIKREDGAEQLEAA